MKKINIYYYYLINIFFMLIPVTIILGNFAINLNILIILLITLVYITINKKKIQFRLNFFDKLILLFFFFTILTLTISYLEKKFSVTTFNNIILPKTILFQRYLILYLAIRFFFQEKVLQLKWFNNACALCASFVCLDILIQFFFGKDLFGITPISARHRSGVFGEELVAGGYIQRFFLFVLIFWQSLKEESIFKKNYIFIILTLLIFFSIILSGNRVPLILFVISLLIYAYLNLYFKKIFLRTFLTLILIFFIVFSLNKNVKTHFFHFYQSGLNLFSTSLFKNLKENPSKASLKPYVVEFYCSKIFFKENPFFGGGIRSYRAHEGGCLTHSHNYYLEVLVDLGIFGLSIIMLLLFFIFKKIYLYVKKNKTLPLEITPYLIILITEFFPIRTSGSIFGTNNAVIIFTFLAVLISYLSSMKKG